MASTRARTLALGGALTAVLIGAVAGIAAGLEYYNHRVGDWLIGVTAIAIGIGVCMGVLLLLAAAAWGIFQARRAHFDVVRLIAVSVTVLLAAATVASTTRPWFTEDIYGETLGYDTNWGKAALALAILGSLWAFAGGFLSWRLWMLDPLIGLASIGVVAIDGATHKPQLSGTAWKVTGWYWAALALTIGWTLAAAVSAWTRRKPGVPPFVWLYRCIAQWLRRDLREPSARVTVSFVGAAASALLLLVGACRPWLTAGIASASGLENSGDGNLVLVLAFFALLALLGHWRLGSRVALLETLVLGAGAAVITIHDLRDLAKGDVGTGWGLNVAADASVGLALFTLVCLFRNGRSVVRPHPEEQSASQVEEPAPDASRQLAVTTQKVDEAHRP